MPRGGSRPGAGRKPKAATADKQATPKAAPAKKSAPKPEAAYVDGNGVRIKNAPANWPFGTVPPPEPPPKEDLSGLMAFSAEECPVAASPTGAAWVQMLATG